ncbi:MAG: NfeD family protein [Chitinispirillaceae bacterium]|nr:NfeD family protein [Chitinispirillaceae bacterium]
MHIEWWYWIIAGVFMLLSEALTPGGFYLLFIGIAAVITGAVNPLIHTAWVEIVLFAALSTLSIALMRKPLVERVRKATPQSDVPEFIGETARAVSGIPAGREGKVEVRGSVWQARNGGVTDIAQNSLCVIAAREGLSFVVKLK